MKVTLLSPALGEIIEAIEYYERQEVRLAEALDIDLSRTLDFIKVNPMLGSPFQAGTRRVLLHHFPYAVVYKALSDRILVVAFSHEKRRPGYWEDRL